MRQELLNPRLLHARGIMREAHGREDLSDTFQTRCRRRGFDIPQAIGRAMEEPILFASAFLRYSVEIHRPHSTFDWSQNLQQVNDFVRAVPVAVEALVSDGDQRRRKRGLHGTTCLKRPRRICRPDDI
jgi:hypothetical protein